jgi:riboflavin biosynthesis pyrimidine reductase
MASSRRSTRTTGASVRPHVICHMVPSVDGKIVTEGWPLPRGLLSEYERTAASLDADAWIIGRVSMEPYAGSATLPARPRGARIPRTDFVARSNAPSYAIAIDPSGKLRWESGSIDEEHAVTVRSTARSPASGTGASSTHTATRRQSSRPRTSTTRSCGRAGSPGTTRCPTRSRRRASRSRVTTCR